jgi:hypothetical protein
MKVYTLIEMLQEVHPNAEVNIYLHAPSGTAANMMVKINYEYVRLDIMPTLGDWGNPGSEDDLVCITAGRVLGY